MSKPAKRYLVDGREMTVPEAADLVGATPGAIYSRMNRNGDDLQAIVSQYRMGICRTRTRHGGRHFIDGKWMTLNQAAEALGMRPGRLRCYMWRNKDAAGNAPSLVEVVEKYRRGEIREQGGYAPKVYRVDGRYMTQAEAARACGVKLGTFRVCAMRKGGVAEAVAFYEARRVKRARDEILKILGEYEPWDFY